MSRAEHLAWAKERALRELNAPGNVQKRIINAISSMQSDLEKHPETQSHAAIGFSPLMLAGDHIKTAADAEKWINDFA